tara:strand:- start:16348 stop:17154 length:807 start_codon:yes stop_codon:yes gene_type:complete
LKKIGIFDSGIGGLSIVTKLKNINLDTEIIYIADNAYFPYGSKDEEVIVNRSCYLVKKLVELGCEIIIVACNTASSASLEFLRKNFQIPIIGIEPAIKPASNFSKSGKMLLLATPLTTSGNRLSMLKKNYVKDQKLFSLPMEGLAEHIEKLKIPKKEFLSEIQTTLHNYYDLGVDCLVLGCTHYHFLKDFLAEISPKHVKIFDSVDGVTNRLLQLLSEHSNSSQLYNENNSELIDCYVTGSITAFSTSINHVMENYSDLPNLSIMKIN